MPSHYIYTLALLIFLLCSCIIFAQNDSYSIDVDATCTDESAKNSTVAIPPPVENYRFPNCHLYVAKSSTKNVGLGLYSSVPIRRGQPISQPDIIIQITDSLNMGILLSDYSWNPDLFGGQYEANIVHSIIPGVGSIANAVSDFRDANAIFYGRRDVDEADVPRTTSPGAGAFTHYHNVSFFALKDINAGEEILITYNNDPWFNERVNRMQKRIINETMKSPDWLAEHGLCVGNLRPDTSKIKGAGRGAFSLNFIPKGARIAPAPLVVVDREFMMTNTTGKKRTTTKPQLLLNYCFGHVNSSLLFYPTSPSVNLINHGGEKSNARLHWSLSDQHEGKDWPWHLSLGDVKNLNRPGFMMDIVATRDILPNEEILMDYGEAWEKAWKAHVQEWIAPINSNMYSPSYVMDDVAALLRTEKEQSVHPYPPNVFTACFYRYSAREINDGIAKDISQKRNEATAHQWKADRRTFEFSNLRPCSILNRDGSEDRNGEKVTYTVIMKNRRGLKPEEVIPNGSLHIVNGVPRSAIRFMDKYYTTDQHLENAFRHEIQIPDEYFPSQWMDLSLSA
jgi:hypothetical protein